MLFLRSIRTKLTLSYTTLVALTLLAFGFSTFILTRATLTENLDRSLRAEVKWVNEFIEPKAKKVRLKPSAILELKELQQSTPSQAVDEPTDEEDISVEERAEVDEMWNQIYQHTLLSPRRHLIQILDRNGDPLYRSLSLVGHNLYYPEIPYGSVNVVTTTGADGKELRLAVMQNDFVKIFVAYPLEPLAEVLDNVFSTFRIIIPITLLLSIIGGWILANQSLKPVDALTKAAKDITAQSLARRLPTHTVDDEIGRLTAQFNDMISRLHASFEQIQTFSAEASHELRTPLTIMRSEIEVALANKRLPQPTRQLLGSIHDELIRLSSIVESLMILVHSESGRHSFSFDQVDLTGLVRELLQAAQTLAEPKHIRVSLHEAANVWVHADAQRLRQLFLNLIENAIKYTSDYGVVALSVERAEGQVYVRVKDSGIGILPDDIPKIFERFYRVERNGNRDPGGAGLGLSIAKWIAEAHEGSIEVISDGKHGSTFSVRLPVR
jgi:heavy metal sensor kinase